MTAFRLAGAGLAAGAANMILGVTFASVLGVEKFQALLRAHDLRAIGEPGDAIPHTIVRLLLGLGVTLLYWAVLPRVGSTVGAALVAAVFGWAFVYAYTAWGYHHIGLFRMSWALMLAGWGLFEMIATALVGAWIATGRGFWK